MSVGIRELARQASQVVEQVASSGRPTLITRNGKPVAALIPIDEEALEDWILANAPEFVANMREADAEVARGERGMSLDDFVKQLDVEGQSAR